jgi:hypothetical protein
MTSGAFETNVLTTRRRRRNDGGDEATATLTKRKQTKKLADLGPMLKNFFP